MGPDPIDDLRHRYADAVCRVDAAQFAATWTPDATWVLGPRFEAEGRDAIVELWHAAMGTLRAVTQHVLNGTYELDAGGERATGRCYVVEHYQRAEGEAGLLLAYYDDEYVTVDGRWCFAARRLTVQYNGPPDLSSPFLGAR